MFLRCFQIIKYIQAVISKIAVKTSNLTCISHCYLKYMYYTYLYINIYMYYIYFLIANIHSYTILFLKFKAF